MRGWWNMACWNGLSVDQQRRLIEVGNLPINYQPEGECQRGASVAIETEGDAAPGPRFYCTVCAIDYLQDTQPRKDNTMNLDQQLFVSREAYVRTKREMCAKHEGPYDMQPQLNVVDETGHVAVGIVESAAQIPMAIGVLENALSARVAFIVSLADTLTAEPIEGQPHQRGNLARRLEAGDPTVRDALVVTVLDVLTNETAASMVTYRYDDFGQPVFDQPEPTEVLGGDVIDLMRQAVGL